MTESLPPALTTTSHPHRLEATNEDRTVNCREPLPSKAPDHVRGGPIRPLRLVWEGLFGRRVPAVVEATTRAAVRQGSGRSTVQAVSPSLRLIMAWAALEDSVPSEFLETRTFSRNAPFGVEDVQQHVDTSTIAQPRLHLVVLHGEM